MRKGTIQAPSPSPRPATRFAAVLHLAAAALASLPLAHALQIPQQQSRFDAIAIPDPSVVVSPATLAVDAALVPETILTGWNSFRAENDGAWDVYLDARSGAPELVQGQGIPFVP